MIPFANPTSTAYDENFSQATGFCRSLSRPFVGVEPGIGGWRAGLGALKMTNELGGGYVMRAGVLHTGKRAWRAPSQATFVGPDFQFMPIFALGVRVGGFIRVAGKGGRGLLTSDLNVLF